MHLHRRSRMALPMGVAALLTVAWAGAQAPMPKPRPITAPPMPKPGLPAPRPSPAAAVEPAPAGAEPAREAGASRPAAAPSPTKPQARPGRSADYGSTPVPWPSGSTDPAHFPAGIPQPAGPWQAVYSMGPLTASAYFQCGETPAAVAQVYQAFLERDGWERVPIPGPPLQEQRILLARKGDWSLRLDAAPHPLAGGTEVFLLVSLKPLPPKPKADAKGGRP